MFTNQHTPYLITFLFWESAPSLSTYHSLGQIILIWQYRSLSFLIWQPCWSESCSGFKEHSSIQINVFLMFIHHNQHKKHKCFQRLFVCKQGFSLLAQLLLQTFPEWVCACVCMSVCVLSFLLEEGWFGFEVHTAEGGCLTEQIWSSVAERKTPPTSGFFVLTLTKDRIVWTKTDFHYLMFQLLFLPINLLLPVSKTRWLFFGQQRTTSKGMSGPDLLCVW